MKTEGWVIYDTEDSSFSWLVCTQGPDFHFAWIPSLHRYEFIGFPTEENAWMMWAAWAKGARMKYERERFRAYRLEDAKVASALGAKL